AVRNGSTPTTVNLSRATTHTVLGTSNHLTYTIQRRQGTGAWTNVDSGGTGTITTSGATGSATSTGNSVTQSYEFRLVVTDKLGRRAESLRSVSTQKVVLDIHKNEGVGIGKIRERGELDVAGEMFVAGQLNLVPESGIPKFQIHSRDENGHAYIEFFGSDGIRKAYVGIPNKTTNRLDIMHNGGENINLATSGKLTFNNTPIVNSGSNSNGHWVRFYDGTQIVWGSINHNFYSTISRYADLPIAFKDTNFSVSLGAGSGDWREIETISAVGIGVSSASKVRFHRFNNANHRKGDYGDRKYTFMAIGRWK